jgi:2-keto-4-pentenoate hydratase
MSNPPNDRIERAALALREARATRHPIPPVSATHGLAGLAEAYAAAELNVRARLAEPGRRVVGKKVGLTSPVVQKQLGVDQPDFGVLFDDMEYLTGAEIPSARLIQPKMEAEVAFVMGADLGPHVPSWAEFLRAVEYALPALEIVDSAIADWKITLLDTVADNASSALFVLGDQPVSVGRLQLAQLPMTLRRGDALASQGTGAACLGHPLRAAWWLARTMAERGQPMRAGEVVMSGALGPMVPAAAGDAFVADLGPLGTVSCRMA